MWVFLAIALGADSPVLRCLDEGGAGEAPAAAPVQRQQESAGVVVDRVPREVVEELGVELGERDDLQRHLAATFEIDAYEVSVSLGNRSDGVALTVRRGGAYRGGRNENFAFEVFEGEQAVPVKAGNRMGGLASKVALYPGWVRRSVERANLAKWLAAEGGRTYRICTSWTTEICRKTPGRRRSRLDECWHARFEGELTWTAPHLPEDCTVAASAAGRSRQVIVCDHRGALTDDTHHFRVVDGTADGPVHVLSVPRDGAEPWRLVRAALVLDDAICAEVERNLPLGEGGREGHRAVREVHCFTADGEFRRFEGAFEESVYDGQEGGWFCFGSEWSEVKAISRVDGAWAEHRGQRPEVCELARAVPR